MRWILTAVIIFLLPNITSPSGGGGIGAREIINPQNDVDKHYDLAQPINDLLPTLDTLVAKSEGVSEKLKTL